MLSSDGTAVEGSPKPLIPGYELDRVLGTGSYGEVWSAVQISTGQNVAVKILTLSRSAGSMLAEEVARLVSVADNPNVLTLLDANLSHEPPYLITPLLSDSLETFADSPATDIPKVVRWFEQIALALRYIHRKGILHCDLKPGNILLDREGAVKVVDFGQAHLLGEEGMAFGTYWYMPPEQATIPLDADTHVIPDICWDVYALGATMYRLLTGCSPRSNDMSIKSLTEAGNIIERMEVYRRELGTHPLVPVRTLNPRVDADLALIVEHCLELDHDERYQTMGEVLDDLRRRRLHYPLEAHAPSAGYVLQRFVKRNRLLIGVSVAFLLILTVSLTSAFQRVMAARNEAEKQRGLALQRLAGMAFEKGVRLIEEGEPTGPLWLAQAAATNPSGDFRLPALGHVYGTARVLFSTPHTNRLAAPSFSADGRLIVTLVGDVAHVLDVPSGTEHRPGLHHPGAVVFAVFSPDGTQLATACDDKILRIWEVASGNTVRLLTHSSAVQCAAFSPDGRRVVTGSGDSVVVWDTGPGQPVLGPLKTDGDVRSLEFSRDGKRILSSTLRTVRVWRASDGQPLTPSLEHPAPIFTSEFSADGNRFVTACRDGVARVWTLGRTSPLVLKHADKVFSASFSPDGTRVLTAAGRVATVWDSATGHAVFHTAAQGDLLSYAIFSPDGSRLATASKDNLAQVCDAVTGRPLSCPLRHGGEVDVALFSPDGTRLLTASSDKRVRLWDKIYGYRMQPPLRHDDEVGEAVYSSDGQLVATASGSKAYFWNASTGQPSGPPVEHADEINDVAFSPDGTRFATGCRNGTARVWDVARRVAVTPLLRHKDEVRSVAFSADGSRLVTASFDRTVKVWDVASGRLLAHLKHGAGVYSASFSPDGTRVVTASIDNTARIWTVKSGDVLTLKHNNWVIRATFSQDGRRVVTASLDGTARVWDAVTGQPVTPPLTHPAQVTSAAFNPSGTRVVTACQDGTACIWDVATGHMATPPLQHHGRVYSATFSADGERVVTSSEDGTARVWLAGSGHPFTPSLQHLDEVYAAVFSPDGRNVLTASKDHTAQIWSLQVDEDEPASLLTLEAELRTGRRLNQDNEASELTPIEFQQTQSSWEQAAREHARDCLFTKANLWLHP